jgi:hypothetical protein
MKTSAKHSPNTWRDMQRDWNGWSPWERRAAGILTIGSMTSAAFWFAVSLNLLR